MPRVIHKEQYRRYKFLNMLWYDDKDLQNFYLLLNMRARHEINLYYLPSKNLTESEFKEHIDSINKQDPELCHRAGKYFKYIETTYAKAFQYYGENKEMVCEAISNCSMLHHNESNNNKSKKQPKVSVVPVLRQHVDIEKFCNALLRLVDYLNKQKKEDSERSKNNKS
jgi:hypothetical protein